MFKDIGKDCIFADDIAYVARTGVMVGDPEGTFRPDQPVTRGELAAVVHRMMLRDGVFADVLPYVVPSVVEIHGSDGRLGSGVCIRDDASSSYILTCRHVVEGIEQNPFTIVIHDGRSFTGVYHVASAVPNEDLAIIDMGRHIPPIALGSPVVQGQPVAVIGSPLGLRESVTVGVVSNVSREENSWFQLDAPINPGNSGGPIINEKGELVGIVNAKVPDAAIPDVGVEGLGYGIKIEIVRRFLGRVWPE
jgi:S1-C subfamily serine protease